MQDNKPADIDLKELYQEIMYARVNIREHSRILRGNKESDEPGGLIYNVSENTKFRKFAVKILWLLFGSVMGLLANQIITIFNP